MKTIKATIISMLILGSLNLSAQTPEQKKQQEEMQKNAKKMMDKMQRQYDSMMNTQEMKEGAVKIKEFQDQLAKEEKAKANQKKSSTTSEDYSKKYLISKGTGTRFENWTYGEAELVLVGMARSSNSPGYTIKIGTISADGNFNFKFPENPNTFMTVGDARWINCSPGIRTNDQKWTNPGAGYLGPTMRIIKNGENLGTIRWASDNALIEGWTTTSDYHDIPGHRMELVYVNAPSKSETVCKIERRYGNGKDFDLYKNINVEFKKGWNLVKTTFEGERIFIDWGEGENNKHNYVKDEKISAQQDLSADTRWLFYPGY